MAKKTNLSQQMNGKRVQVQKSVKTCNEKLTKQPKKNTRTWSLFGKILDNFGTIFGHFLGSRRHPKSESKREPIFDCFLTDFGSLLGPLLGAMLRQNGPPKLSKVTFFEFFTIPKSMHFQKTFCEAFGILLGPSWDRFGSILGSFWKPKSMPTSTLTKRSKMHFRFDENQKFNN